MKGVQTCALPITDLEKSSGIRSAIYNHFRDSFRSDFVNVHLGETWPPLYPCEPIRQCATLCPEGRQAEEIIACKIGHVRNVGQGKGFPGEPARTAQSMVHTAEELVDLGHRRRSEERRVGKEGLSTCRSR